MKRKSNSCTLQFVLLVTVCCIGITGHTQTSYPTPVEGDFLVKDFVFADGEKIPSLKLHYTMIGSPQPNRKGK